MSTTNDYRINIFDWDIDYAQFIEWVRQTDVDIVILSGVEYQFIYEEDFVAFKLTFETRTPVLMRYKGVVVPDTGHYYCPYIPLIIKDV